MNKSVKIISNIVYGIGVIIVICLAFTALFGSDRITNPDAMIPLTWKERAFIWMAAGSIPMLLACMAVYKLNELKNSTHKKSYFFIIFLPGFICGACLLFISGILIAGMVNSFLLH